MKVTLLPSCHPPGGGVAPDQYLTSWLIDEAVAIDAGSLGFWADPVAQARVRHVLITHTHADHIASLPIFVENAYEGGTDCVTVHASEVVLEGLRLDVFNDRVWPDFLKLSEKNPKAPFLKVAALEPGVPLEIEGLRFTPVPVDHLVPTLGLVVEAPGVSVVVPSDTGPTQAIWDHAARLPDLQAVFLEVAFPDAMAGLAEVSKHLTPATFALEVAKMPPGVRVFVVHIKPRFRDAIIGELDALGLPNVEVCRPGETYDFRPAVG